MFWFIYLWKSNRNCYDSALIDDEYKVYNIQIMQHAPGITADIDLVVNAIQ